MSTLWQVTIKFVWPEGLEPGGDPEDYAPGDPVEWDIQYHDGAPFQPTVRETIVFDDFSQPDELRSGMNTQMTGRRFLQGIVKRRSFDFNTTNYPGRVSCDTVMELELELVQAWHGKERTLT